jgi:rhamnose utilization protein RhaD (predicted bifunctional aldolase and dehydrogenase)/NAD(P)-dependent dehydrogenase (short-subunit alcohol dehydrogenase family)
MQSLWLDADADAAIGTYAGQGVNEDVALRVYTTRLLGSDRDLVLHGGGNTSVKTVVDDMDGSAVEVLCVKGSGWDMATIEPPGLPAVRLAPLTRLEDLDRLGDEDMVRHLRRNLLDPGAPTPSIETLLHAFLPHKFVDHTHASAVLALSDQPDGEAVCADVFAGRAAIVPFTMPGFELAKACAAVWRADRQVEGLVLHNHGIFAFGDTAREAYERMIGLVDLAERRIPAGRKDTFVQVSLPQELAGVAEVAPIVRGALAARRPDGEARRVVLEHRASGEILAFVGGRDVADYSQRGTITPDHVLRTKGWPVVLGVPERGGLERFAASTREAVEAYVKGYGAYFERNNARFGGAKTPLDSLPRVALVPGIGLFAAGASARDAAAAGDLAETAIAVITQAEAFGRYAPLSVDVLFDMEYWSLEQAKLGKGKEPALARHVVAVTGGAGGIGRATAAAFGELGADVALMDLQGEALEEAAHGLGALAVPCDLTDRRAIASAFEAVASRFGGLDILVSNAGATWLGDIADVEESVMRASFELNFWAHQRAAQAAVAIMRAQGTGGALLFNISKQAVNPGPNLGPYGIAKAAALALMRQYAVELGALGITSNAVNADRIRSGLLTPEMIAMRSAARGVSEEDYMAGNLLHREVSAQDVAQAFVQLAQARASTGAVVTVDGGNVAAMLR